MCHTGAAGKERAGFPAVALCQGCHKDYGGTIPSKRVYRLPDFVIFSHAVHVRGKVECRTCHGDTWGQETVTVFRPLKMQECVDCHKEKRATEACNACHELGQ